MGLPGFLVLAIRLCFLCSVLTHSAHGYSQCEAKTDCCSCVETPGCSYFHPDPPASPFCAYTQGMNETMMLRTWQKQAVIIQRSRPINYGRRRLITPQLVQFRGNLGVSEVVPFRVMSRSRNVRLRITWPRDDVKIDVFKEFSWTCERGLGRSVNSSPRERRRRNQRLEILCTTSAPGETIGLRLRITVTRCSDPSVAKVVRVRLMTPGQRSSMLRVNVDSNCVCMGQNFSLGQLNDVETCLTTEAEGEELDANCMDRAWDNSCQLQDQPLCSGNGVCLCGQCSCHPANATGSPRYTGMFCGCNNNDCPRSHDGELCGGPRRGMCQCGNCVCHPGWTGQACDCSANPGQCPRDDGGRVCSNHGQCVCGECRCEDGYSGTACECSPNSCPRSTRNGLPCGGPERGVCECGQCLCIGPVIGQSCDDDVDLRPVSVSYSPCSGRGTFRRGQCVCEQPYGGNQCELCPTCSSSCQNYRTCVVCQALSFLVGSPQCANCPSTDVEYRGVYHLPDGGNLCVYRHNSCSIEFSYRTASNGSTLVHYNTNILVASGSRTSDPSASDCN